MRKPRRLFANKPLIRHWRACEPTTYWRYTWPAPILGTLFAFLILIVLGIGLQSILAGFNLPLWMVITIEVSTWSSAIGVSVGITLSMKERALRAFTRRMLAEEHDRICPACGYNLTALSSGHCPECGSERPTKVEDYAL